MSDSQSSVSSVSSGNIPLPLLQQPRPEPNVTLAKIFMMRGRDKSEWNGTEPEYYDILFVYAHIGNTTYNSYMPRNKGYSYNPNFTNMRAGLYHLAGASFLHCSNGSIILPLMKGAHHDITQLQSNCRIYHDKENKIWYKLNKGGYDPDTEVSTNGFISRHVSLKIPIDSIRHIHQSNVGAPCSIGSDYTPLTEYITGKHLHLLMREARLSSRPKRQRIGGGGKTRRKFKVKKRRNRRIRNTMKRRKTAVKRRKGRK
jgi:hypothetical protein